MIKSVEESTADVAFIVSDAMTATLEGREIHPVCSTFWLVYYAEVACRRALEPFLEIGEDAVGTGISIQHHAMAAIGAQIRIRSKVTVVQGRLVRCEYQAWSENTNTLLAEGIQDQLVLRTEVLASKVAAAVR